jgi:hypothetical protein
MHTDSKKHEKTTDANDVLPTVFSSIEEAVKELGLSKRVKWKNYLGYLCRYTKKDICPEFVVKDGLPVQIKGG